jgi:dTDP-4-amino-4,6-dideoxygalactose transaminase
MFYQLPPAGERIVRTAPSRMDRRLEDLFAPFSARFYQSGTAALAAALKAAVAAARKDAPEVVMSAYGCPDLISAVLYAGARPRLVDLIADRPWLDLDRLSAALNANTVAVVAVDLFGIPERNADIKALLHERNILLVQDSAQALPGPEQGQWQGDFIILSFGRGKPVSLLNGGAVLFRDATLGGALPTIATPRPASIYEILRYRIKVQLFNALIHPRLYWLPARLPFLGLGKTHFRPLASIRPASAMLGRYLTVNISEHWNRSDAVQQRLSTMLAEVSAGQLQDLSVACHRSGHPPRLMRFPILAASAELRDRLFHALNEAGLGAAKMYPATLPNIQGLESIFAQDNGNYPQADSFAQRILTLPTHSQVREADLLRMRACICTVLGR